MPSAKGIARLLKSLDRSARHRNPDMLRIALVQFKGGSAELGTANPALAEGIVLSGEEILCKIDEGMRPSESDWSSLEARIDAFWDFFLRE